MAEKTASTPKPAGEVVDAAVKKLAAAIQGAPMSEREELIQNVLNTMAELQNPDTGE